MLLRLALALPDLHRLDALTAPWRHAFAHSAVLPTAVLFGHLGGLLAAGSLAVAANRGVLRARAEGGDAGACRRDLDDRARAHAPMVAALAVAMLSGALLFLADVEAFAGTWLFWAKMGLVLALLANGANAARLDALFRARGDALADPVLWHRRRRCAVTSVALWFALVLAGAALANR